MTDHSKKRRQKRARSNTSMASLVLTRNQRVAVVKGQDNSRWTDFYHSVLRAPWWAFLAGLAGLFIAINIVFALAYLADAGGIVNARPGNFWDAFLFSAQTIGSVDYSLMAPKTVYADTVVIIEAFVGFIYLGLLMSVMFARFSRPFARIIFSNVAIVTNFDDVPTLMFRAANQRGNQILDAAISVFIARQQVSKEGMVMRRFEEMRLVRERTPLFSLSWTVMHPIDESSPLHGLTPDRLVEQQIEIIAFLQGTDETLADKIYARYAYGPDDIVWNQRFVDVLSLSPQGRRVVDLNRFHDTEPTTA